MSARASFDRLRIAWCSVQWLSGVSYSATSVQHARLGDALYALDGSDSLDVVCFPRPRADNGLTAASATGK